MGLDYFLIAADIDNFDPKSPDILEMLAPLEYMCKKIFRKIPKVGARTYELENCYLACMCVFLWPNWQARQDSNLYSCNIFDCYWTREG